MAGHSYKKQFFSAMPRKKALVIGLLCSTHGITANTAQAFTNPNDHLPQIFTRVEYISASSNLDGKNYDTEDADTYIAQNLRQLDFFQPLAANGLASIQSGGSESQTNTQSTQIETEAISDLEYAQQDLDLALENFFFALEDLIQSAARFEETSPQQESDAYIAQVQFPAQVMSTFGSTDRASNAVVERSIPSTTISETEAPTQVASGFGFLNEFNYTTSIGAEVEHNDNIYTTGTNATEDQILRTHINSVAESRSRKSALKFEGDILAGNYLANSENNYVDWSATGSYSTLLSQRSKAFGGIGYFYHHEDRGEGSTDGNLDFSIGEPVEFESWVARGIYERGTQQTRARLVADAKVDLLRTTNFQDIASIRSRDRNIATLLGRAFYNWSQRLSYVAELRHMDIAYVNAIDELNLDSTQTRYAIGAEWLATRQTAGSVRIGYQDKNYRAQPEENSSGLSWEAIVEWAPKPRTEMVFETIKDLEESDGFGVARDRTDLKVTWKQRWTPRLDSSTSVQYGTTDFIGEVREDELALLQAQLNYSLTNSSAASLKLTYIENSSNVDEFDFDRSQIQLGVNMDL